MTARAQATLGALARGATDTLAGLVGAVAILGMAAALAAPRGRFRLF